MSIFHKIRRHGILGSLRKGLTLSKRKSGYPSRHCRHAPRYSRIVATELEHIEPVQKPGCKGMILPLRTRYRTYASPKYFGEGHSDTTATEYVRIECGVIRSLRKYDAAMLTRRILAPIRSAGMKYRLLILRNKAELGNEIYCHFILEIER